MEPTNASFTYCRDHPPFFFTAPSQHEKIPFNKSMSTIGREYFRLIRDSAIHHNTVLSNGMTAGEFAMSHIYASHRRRFK